MQATIQKHIDHSISSTVNLPREATEKDVSDIYFKAWEMGCKGITVYREGSREGILITNEEMERKASSVTPTVFVSPPQVLSTEPVERARPKVTRGQTEKISTPRGPIYVTVNQDDRGLCEVFVRSLDEEADVVGRLASLLLRTGVDPRELIEQLWRVKTREVAYDRAEDGTNIPITTVAQGIALAIGRFLYGNSFNPLKNYPKVVTLPEPKLNTSNSISNASGLGSIFVPSVFTSGKDFAGICPDCGEILIKENGCSTCKSCGFSKCG
jgi:ribonucleoside-diphosphate reductase alpha chain